LDIKKRREINLKELYQKIEESGIDRGIQIDFIKILSNIADMTEIGFSDEQINRYTEETVEILVAKVTKIVKPEGIPQILELILELIKMLNRK
jgi:hypothetical protein